MQFNQAALLYQLQAIDISIGKQRTRLKEIDALLNNDESVTGVRTRLAAAEEAIKPAQSRALDLELEIKSLTAKIQEEETSLYSGKTTNTKELTELQQEVESLKRHFTQLNESLLESMMQVESTTAEIDGLRAALNEATEALAVKHSDLLKEQRQLKQDLAETKETRKEAAAKIDPAYIKAYDDLRVRMKSPVSRLVEDGCTICGVEQTSTLAHRARHGREIVYCGSCGRILAAF